ncbi:hypothetical protein J7384_17310 [Endozoicomonas sp. G2_1]|uniref:hypothetical protein n=1 Tax=Endozoicomonas sp. G2_1 TaxID=2821091 RepID=UPI001ADD32E9|nr:hypothetical protein [Endozoicomonas sp. G2_1]MBO9492124.1 hypothetical protein [Endozoicomonas sp. G2_1]
MSTTAQQCADIVQAIYKNYQTRFNGEFRPHLGASMGGHQCLRHLYYNFRHAISIEHDGRLLKLFQRGHKEEFTFADELNRVGFRLLTTDPNGNQFRLTSQINTHISGSGDGFAEVLTEQFEHFDLNEWVVVEMKTHNDKSFTKLEKEGVEKSKPLHFTQMQLYMKWSQLSKALYIAVNKNTDALYVEVVHFQQEHADHYENRMVSVASSKTIPIRLHEDPSHFECRFCDHYAICHTEKYPLNVTCRTCAHIEPKPDGTWDCNYRNEQNLHPDLMTVGCKSHVFHPDFLANIAVAVDFNDAENFIEYEFDNGLKLKNGTQAKTVIDSESLAAIVRTGYEFVDSNVLALLNDFDATFEGVSDE